MAEAGDAGLRRARSSATWLSQALLKLTSRLLCGSLMCTALSSPSCGASRDRLSGWSGGIRRLTHDLAVLAGAKVVGSETVGGTLRNTLLPMDVAVADIVASDVAAWEQQERAAGYAEASTETWRSTRHLILGAPWRSGCVTPTRRRCARVCSTG